MNEPILQKAITVSQCIELLKTALSATVGCIRMQGEISKVSYGRNGSLTFIVLKDKESSVSCFIASNQLTTRVEQGKEVIVDVFPTIFKTNGGLNLKIQKIDLLGIGDLQKKFVELKLKLEKEGLFDVVRKRLAPIFPEKIGIITAEHGDAFIDVMRQIKDRWPYVDIVLAPTAVQGSLAIQGICKSFKDLVVRAKPDVIILTRGGGSLEDLQAFNSEEVARAIFACPIPVIVGVGHERDITIADLVADKRAITPTNAGELVVPNRQDILVQIDSSVDVMIYALTKTVEKNKYSLLKAVSSLSGAMSSTLERVNQMISQVKSFGVYLQDVIRAHHTRLESLTRSSRLGIDSFQDIFKRRLDSLFKLLHSVSPKALLRRGYSITRVRGKVITSSKQIAKRDILITTLADGEIESEVTK